MKTTNLFYMVCLLALSLVACDKDAHKDEMGLVVSLDMPNEDPANSIQLWVYNATGTFVDTYKYNDSRSLAASVLPLGAGDYVLIAATNLTPPFSTDELDANNTKPYERLIFQLDEASSSPAHAHYGKLSASVSDKNLSAAQVTMNRILAELQFTIKDVPSNVVRAEAQVNNASTAFIPYNEQLLVPTAVVDLGSIPPQGDRLNFPLKRLMPVLPIQTTVTNAVRGVDDIAPGLTSLTFVFHYADGQTIRCDATSPALENGGSYIPEVSFKFFRPEITVSITQINGWREGSKNEGEILNPSK